MVLHIQASAMGPPISGISFSIFASLKYNSFASLKYNGATFFTRAVASTIFFVGNLSYLVASLIPFYQILSYTILSYLILSYLLLPGGLPHPISSYLILSYPILSYLVLLGGLPHPISSILILPFLSYLVL